MPYKNSIYLALSILFCVSHANGQQTIRITRAVPTIGETFSLLEQCRNVHHSREGDVGKAANQARPFGIKAAECSTYLWAELSQKEEMDDARNHRKLYDLCSVMSKGVSAEKLTEILGVAHGIIQQFKDPELQSYAMACALVNASVSMAEIARREIVQAIDRLQEILDYWIEQRHHSLRYFLHKSPLKWFQHKPQNVEIEENIKMVRDMQAQYFTLFGQLAARLERFCGSEHDTKAVFAWLDDFATVLHYLCVMSTQKTHSSLPDAPYTYAQFQQLAHKLRFKTSRIARLTRPVMWSHHLVRHWLSYTACTAVSIATAAYVIQNPDKASAYVARMQKKGTDVYEWVADKLLQVWDVIIPVKDKAKSAAAKDILPQKWATKADLYNSTWSIESLHCINKVIETSNVLVADKVITQERADEIVHGVIDGSLTGLPDLLWSSLKDVHFFNPSTWIAKIGKAAVAVTDPYYNKALNVTQKVNKQSSLIIGMALTGVLGVASHRVISYLMAPRVIDYSHIRIALADAARVLNLYSGYDSSMTIYSEDLGRFLYSIERLYKEMRVIKEPERWEFARDLHQLAQPQLSVSQKLRLIDIMYKRYPFLVQQ